VQNTPAAQTGDIQTAPVYELKNGARLPFGIEGSSYGRVRTLTDRRTGETYQTRPHSGLDQPQALGVPVPSVADGNVIFVGGSFENSRNGGYGAHVIVQHDNGIATLYGHNSAIHVTQGQRVVRGQVISNVGNSGHSTGPHMHYEVRTGTATNAAQFYALPHHNPSTFDWRGR
jgi:murein DD-endopeptidase MepM/ murein hydrolase activator NlpD